MSTWYETDDEDIDIDEGEVNIYITDDRWGGIYKTLTFKQVEEIYQKIQEKAPQ